MFIQANDIQMNCELSGKKGASVVVMSHSLCSSLLMWNPQVDALNASFQVLRYDTRGHGRSDAPSGAYTMDLLAKDVIQLLDALSMDRVHFVGLSMGGMIGQVLALNYASRLKSLTLCDTGSVVPPEAQPLWQERIDKVRAEGMKNRVEETMDRWFNPSFLARNSEILAIIRREILATPVSGYIGCAEAIRKVNYLDRLSEIQIPTLIIVGEDDPGTPVAASEAMHKRISNSKLAVLPSARHLSNVEQAQAFNAVLLDFLKQPIFLNS